ncbi:tetratricopeptide repeat protein, partial [Roseofilum capinflatum]
MDFITQPKARLIGSTALLAGGTVCGGVLGTSVASVVAGIIANDVIPQHMENLTVRLRDSRGQLHNHDLAEAVGLAIGLLIKARAEAGTYPGSKKGLVSLAEYTVKHWKTIAKDLENQKNEKFDLIQDSQVLGLFSQALGQKPVKVLTEPDWLALLHELCDRLHQEHLDRQEYVFQYGFNGLDFAVPAALFPTIKCHLPPEDVLKKLATELDEKFAFALQEVLKADFDKGGKAFGKFTIAMLGAIHNGLQQVQVSQEKQEQLNQALAKLGELQQDLARNEARFRQLSEQLGVGIEVILGEIGITQDILSRLRGWLYGELSQIGKTLAEIQDIASDNSRKLDDLLDRVGTLTPTPQPESTSSVFGDALPQINDWQEREELATIHRWLDNGNRKLGIIVGIAGMGKTALAVKVCLERQDFVGKYWAELGNPPLFSIWAKQVLRELVGVSQDILENTLDTQLSKMLVEKLQQKRFLLVLDNFESVVKNEDYLEFLQRCLRCLTTGDQTEILVTTQVEPQLSWIHTPQILPLKFGLSKSKGAQLLAARGVEGTDEEREQFSQKVSGHPLTLSLAGGMLSTQRGDERITLAELTTDISQAIQQLKGRHREEENVPLLVVLDRCWSCVSPVWQERLLLLTVLRQGFDRPLVEAIVRGSIGDEELPNLAIQGFLVALEKKDKEKLQRYEFQPFILQYLRCRVEDVREAHKRAVEVYRSRCEMPEDWKTATVEDVQDYLELFYHLCQLGEYEQAFDVIYSNPSQKESVTKFLHIRGYNALLIELYLQLVPHLPNQQDWRYPASLTSLGNAYHSQGDDESAISYHQQSLKISQQIRDRSGIATSFNNLGSAYYFQGDYRKAMFYHHKSLTITRKIGDRSGIATSLMNLGSAYYSQGDYERAISFHQQSLEIKQEIGDRSGIANSFNNLGNVYYAQGDYERAISYDQQSLEIKREIGDRSGIASSLVNLGSAYHSQGDYESAISFYQQSLEIFQQIGDRSGIASSLGNLG